MISQREEVGEVPEVLVMSGAVKIFTLNTALRDVSSRDGEHDEEEEEESCDVSFPAFCLSCSSVVTSFFASSHQTKWGSNTHQCSTLYGVDLSL